MNLQVWAIVVAVTAASGCASVTSRSTAAGDQDGLVYRLPNRALKVSVTFEKSGGGGLVKELQIAEGAYYPDPSPQARYVARLHRGAIGKTDTTITVDSQGLLSGASSKYTASITDLAAAAGSVVGTLAHGFNEDSAGPCNIDASAQALVFLPRLHATRDGWTGEVETIQSAACSNVRIEIRPLIDGTVLTDDERRIRDTGASTGPRGITANGLWYRVNEPYVARVTAGNKSVSAIVMLPDRSPRYFIGVHTGLFASGENKLTFASGTLTSVQRVTDSELIALFKLPAEILGSYADAIGNVFSSFQKIDKAERDTRWGEVSQQLALMKLSACRSAIDEGQPPDVIAELCKPQ